MTSAPTPPPARFNFAAHVLGRAAAQPDHVAYVDESGMLTYGELAQRVRQFATALAALGLRPEERVLLLAHDGLQWPVAFLGALYAGVVPVAVNTMLTSDDYAYMLAHSRARAAIVSPALLATLESAMARAAHGVESVIVCAAAGEMVAASRHRDFETLLRGAAPQATPFDTAGDDIGFWLYSSGSTGRPKGTVHTHANLYWTHVTYAQNVLALTPDDTVFSAAKLYFAYGLGNALTFPLCAGASVVLMAERPTPAAVWKRITTHKPTMFFGVPTLYAAMLADAGKPARRDVAMRACRWPTAKSATSTFADRARRCAIGPIASARARHSKARGPAAATSTCVTKTATTRMPAAPTTCSRSAASTCRRSKSRPR